jgi:O-antigen/teichoic acid export membrane protein
LANVLDYGYNVAMGRLLSADGYGIVVALQAVLQIVSVSMVVGSTVVARYVAGFLAREQREQMRTFVQDGLRSTILWGGVAALLLGLLSRPVARLLQIPTAWPVVAIAIALLPMVVKLMVVGPLQGLQRFNALGVVNVVQAASRFVLGLLLVKLGLDAAGALAALPIGTTITVLLGLALLGGVVWQRTDAAHQVGTAELARYASTTMVGVVSFALLTNVDALVVKHYFDPLDAGHYSMVVTLGKIVIFMPAVFAQVLFPKSAERYVQRRDSSRLLRLSQAATLVPCVGLAGAYLLLPDPILRVVFGVQNPFSGPVLGLVGLAMSGYALVNVWLNYFLSVEQTRFVYGLLIAVVVQIGLLVLFHATLIQVAAVLTLTALGILIFAEVWFRLYR